MAYGAWVNLRRSPVSEPLSPELQQRFRTADLASTGEGLAWLSRLTALTLEGHDCVDFLQGYLTCDSTRLTQDAWQPTAICDLKGRVFCTLWCRLARADAVELVLHASMGAGLQAFLGKYLMFAKAQLKDAPAGSAVLGVLGDGPGYPAGPKRRLLIVREAADAELLAMPVIAEDAFVSDALRRGDVFLSERCSGRFLPQALGLETLGYVDFDKGCYLGQEIVARAQHRGQVKQRPTLLAWQSNDPLPPLEDPAQSDTGETVTLLERSRVAVGEGLALAVSREPIGELRQHTLTYHPVDAQAQESTG